MENHYHNELAKCDANRCVNYNCLVTFSCYDIQASCSKHCKIEDERIFQERKIPLLVVRSSPKPYVLVCAILVHYLVSVIWEVNQEENSYCNYSKKIYPGVIGGVETKNKQKSSSSYKQDSNPVTVLASEGAKVGIKKWL